MNPRIVYPDIFNINIARILLPLQVGDELQKKENGTLVLRCEVWYTIISRKDRKD